MSADLTLATWNVNSIRARMPRVYSWLNQNQPDLLCVQETKVRDEDFPTREIESLGYRMEFHGQKTYNGVALISREPLTAIVRGLPGDGEDAERRVIGGRIGDVSVLNLYVPNGQSVGTEKYEAKLTWLERLRRYLEEERSPGEPLVLCGDFNIAPEDRDVHDPALWRGRILCSDRERAAFRSLLDWGLVDVYRRLQPEPGGFTWWDYQMGGFRRDRGLRIDYFLATEPLAARMKEIVVDRTERGESRPSDHAPVITRIRSGGG